MRRIPYGRQRVGLLEAHAAFRATLGSSITQGPRVLELEEKVCEFTGAAHAVAVSSGTAALHIAALAAGVGNEQRTFVPSLTFAATASSVLLSGGKPQIVDVSESTWNLDFQQIPRDATSVVTVDFAGLPSGIAEFLEHFPTMKVIEDCAHSLGARTPRGAVGGNFGALMSCFSLHPVKAITSGEGGIVTTNDPETAEMLRRIRSHGINREVSSRGWEYDIELVGLNYRITDIQAAIAVTQLRRLKVFVEKRNEIAERYRHLLQDVPIQLPPEAQKGYVHAYHLFPVLLRSTEEREYIYNFMHQNGILVQVHYKPLHELTVFSRYSRNGPPPVASSIGARILSLPIFPGLSTPQQRRIVKILKSGLLRFSQN